ncbi:MAG: cation:proton antiporter [Candidatus Gastranaerophilaceae bacterium]|jgi:Kef-type K+ transport system membrane component KefB|nr:cation:proton antiporter [Christensenellales bacterium]
MNNLFCLAAALGMGLLLSRVVKKLNLPDVTGFLIAGLIIGPYCLGVFSGESLEAVSDITAVALGFIAFSIGGEFKKENLKRVGMKAFIITVFQAMAAVILVDAALILAGFDIPLAITLGAIATATAPAATLMVVRQYKARGKMTNTLLSVVAMDDAIGLAVFSISLAIAQSLTSGAVPTVNNMLLQPLIEIVLSLLIGFAIGAIASICIRFFKSRANRLCITIASVLLGVALSNMLGLSSLLLCMSIGAAVVNLRSDAETILEGAERWTTPLFMLFFVISGAELDLTVLTSVGLLGLIYIVSRSIGKYFGAYLGARIVKSEPSIQRYLGLTLLPQAGVAIGMAQIVMSKLPEYGAQIRAVVLCATLIYELVGPVLTRIALVKSGEIDNMPKQKKVKKGELKAG